MNVQMVWSLARSWGPTGSINETACISAAHWDGKHNREAEIESRSEIVPSSRSMLPSAAYLADSRTSVSNTQHPLRQPLSAHLGRTEMAAQEMHSSLGCMQDNGPR